MAKTKTNEQIFADIRERGMMTEQEMKLLLRRSNAEGKDLLDYDLTEDMNDGYGIPLPEEQGRKALVWLYKQLRKRNNPLGFRERDIIEKAKPDEFTLIRFERESNGFGRYWFTPLYMVGGMEYIVTGGEMRILA